MYLVFLVQLTPDDETFLSANAGAALSQFERVSSNLGKFLHTPNIKASQHPYALVERNGYMIPDLKGKNLNKNIHAT